MANNFFQTLSQLFFNKFKQDCPDVKATVSRKIRLTVHFDEESVLRHLNSRSTDADEGMTDEIYPTSKRILFCLKNKVQTHQHVFQI